MKIRGYSLEHIIKSDDLLKQVYKKHLNLGDYIIVKTTNSVYKICKQNDFMFEVQGGWFDKEGLSPALLTIRGCTLGGSSIQHRIIAACGLCLEFGNNLVTSPIQKIVVVKASTAN